TVTSFPPSIPSLTGTHVTTRSLQLPSAKDDVPSIPTTLRVQTTFQIVRFVVSDRLRGSVVQFRGVNPLVIGGAKTAVADKVLKRLVAPAEVFPNQVVNFVHSLCN